MFEQRLSRRDRAGFTMIELLTVIGIIIILMGILIPVVSSVRRKGFEADTQHELNSLATACGNYFQDFHSYPGPLPNSAIHGFGLAIFGAPLNADSGAPNPNVSNLNTIHIGSTTVNEPSQYQGKMLTDITASQNMVLGLLGGLSLNPNGNSSNNIAIANFDVTLVNKGPSSLNSLAAQHYPAYYDPNKYELSNDGVGNLMSAAPLGYIVNGVQMPPACTGSFVVPDFLDHFPTPLPIIYLRAVPGASMACDMPFQSQTGTGGALYMTSGSQYYSGEMTPYCPNFFNQIDPGSLQTTPLYSFSTANNGQQPGLNFFQNQSIQDQSTPRSKDSFIMISAGFDGLYGTKDDIIYSN